MMTENLISSSLCHFPSLETIKKLGNGLKHLLKIGICIVTPMFSQLFNSFSFQWRLAYDFKITSFHFNSLIKSLIQYPALENVHRNWLWVRTPNKLLWSISRVGYWIGDLIRDLKWEPGTDLLATTDPIKILLSILEMACLCWCHCIN